MSMQARLIVIMSMILCTLFTAVLVISYDKGVHEVEEFLDGQLALSTRLLDAQVQNMLDNDRGHADSKLERQTVVELIASEDRGEYEPELAFKVWDSSNRLLLQSANANDMPQLQHDQKNIVLFNDRQWLVNVRNSDTGMYVIQTAHPLDTRDTVGLDVMWRVISPLLIGVPLLLIAVYLVVRKTFQPISRLCTNISQRAVNDTEPIALDGVIDELKPLIRSFNGLLERIGQSLKNEQQFTANAAHELRSPIAGIKVQAQVAALSADIQIKNRSINQILLGIQRCERLINQMLRLARLDPDHSDTLKLAYVNAGSVANEAVEAAGYVVQERKQQVILDVTDEHALMLVDKDLLLTALSNLLENASKYSPVETTINFRVSFDGTEICFEISDQGEGIEPDQIDQLRQRFARGQNTQGQTGAGLGLAIVGKVVSLHQGRFDLQSNPRGGLTASVCIPNASEQK